ncbi:MAG: hypothetical protein FWG77_07155 [Treponema sp.]|nr:hypothetical protein [Treponema sp.]
MTHIGKGIIPMGIIILAVTANLGAQSLEDLPGIRERAVILRIVSRVIEGNQTVSWDSENINITIPGRPVGIKLVGSNLVVAVQFTPFLRQSGQHTLVAQGQIWLNTPDGGISYSSTMQTIPLEFMEQVYFFPLGPMRAENEPLIEIQLVLEPYSENERSERATRRRNQSSP